MVLLLSAVFRRGLQPRSSMCLRSNVLLRMMSSGAAEDEVILEKKGNKGVITLNRPKALNTLTLPMIRKIYPQLKLWEVDPDMRMVIIKGAGERAFCAGGDVKVIAESVKSGDTSPVFFKEEYRLNNLIGMLQIPYVALIDGIVMGGGVGVSIHGPFRVATERTVFAMPETAIGFFPDVGGSHFLPRLPGKLGLYLGLTGYTVTGRDVLKAGVATHFVDSKQLHFLEEDLLRLSKPTLQDIDRILIKYQEQWEVEYKKEFALKRYMGRINSAFSGDSVEHIIDNLQKDTSDWSKQQLETLQKMSPLSLKVTFRLLQEGAKLTLQECLQLEYRVASRLMKEHDFYEGVRAALIDKDKSPKWDPSSLKDVTPEQVNAFFEPLPSKEELKLP